MTNVQRVHNDLERSGENVRRRLESQVQMMDNQMCIFIRFSAILLAHFTYRQDLQSQLSQERKTMRHVTLQKDIDVEDLQSRLDKTVRHRALKVVGYIHPVLLDQTALPSTRVPRRGRD